MHHFVTVTYLVSYEPLGYKQSYASDPRTTKALRSQLRALVAWVTWVGTSQSWEKGLVILPAPWNVCKWAWFVMPNTLAWGVSC